MSKLAVKPPFSRLLHPLDRFADVAAHDEDLAHHPHRRADALADERLAGARDQPLQRARLLAVAGQRAADDEAPGRGVDQGRIGLALVRAPVALAELVGDQAVGGLGIGHAQERLGEADSRATPSWVLSRYSWRNWLTQPLALRLAQLGEHGQRARLDPRPRIGVERGAPRAAAPAPRVRAPGAACRSRRAPMP